jgi:hypothetical protein
MLLYATLQSSEVRGVVDKQAYRHWPGTCCVCLSNKQGNVGTVQRNTEARSCNQCSSEKAIIITYSEGVSVAFVIQHAKRMRHIVICDLSGYTIFFHIIS